MKALSIKEPEDVQIIEVPELAAPAEGEVLLRIKKSATAAPTSHRIADSIRWSLILGYPVTK